MTKNVSIEKIAPKGFVKKVLMFVISAILNLVVMLQFFNWVKQSYQSISAKQWQYFRVARNICSSQCETRWRQLQLQLQKKSNIHFHNKNTYESKLR